MNTHFTAWLVSSPSALDQPFMDVAILEDELIGDDPAKDGNWSSKGDPVFFAVTTVSAKDGDADDAIRQAEDLMGEAGWRKVGKWKSVDTGSVVTVERN